MPMLTKGELERYKSVKRANTKPAKKKVLYDGTGADLQPSAVREEKQANKPTTTQKKKDPNRFKAISDRANAKLTDEKKAAIQKNNDRIYWQNKERMNNSGSYKAMMQSRTKGEMQRASARSLSGPRTDEIKGTKNKKNSAYKMYEKAFGKR